MARQIKRYNMVHISHCGEAWQELCEDETGEWIRYEDVAPLLAEFSQQATNSAMVPCPLYVDPSLSICPVFGGECGGKPCQIARHQ
jgi:hypothetical protein